MKFLREWWEAYELANTMRTARLARLEHLYKLQKQHHQGYNPRHVPVKQDAPMLLNTHRFTGMPKVPKR